MKAWLCQQEPEPNRHIVERFERVALANLGTFNEMVEPCRIADVNPRPLSQAFRIILGTTPSRHLHALRLAKARLQWRGSSRDGRKPVRCRPRRTVRQFRREHQPILRLPYMRFDASPRALASHWAHPTLPSSRSHRYYFGRFCYTSSCIRRYAP